MNTDQAKGFLKEMQGKIKAKWGELTDDDLAMAEGKAGELAGKIQQKYGGAKEQIAEQLKKMREGAESAKR
ncbi:MAG: CsbD family protein [Chloroflexi bacterium]|nr:CsbD family protein [Chloroflexota bacterium]